MKSLISEIQFIFLNYFVAHIPLWALRKFFYKLNGVKIEKGARILMRVTIFQPNKIVIGRNSIINEYVCLDGRGGLTIGNNVSIANYAKIISGTHDLNDGNFSYITKPVTIEDNVAVFMNAILCPGVTLKEGAVIAAGSVVPSGTYDAFKVYGGNPCKEIKELPNKNKYELKGWVPYLR